MYFLEWKCFNYDEGFHWSLFLGGQTDNIPSLVLIMAWRRPGDKPLSKQGLLVDWRIYASLGPNELNEWTRKQDGRHLVDDTSKCSFVNEKLRVLTGISSKFVQGPVYKVKPLSTGLLEMGRGGISIVTFIRWNNSVTKWRHWATFNLWTDLP